MRIAIVHQAVAAGAGPDELDVLVQVDSVQASLARLGHACVVIPCTLDLQAFSRQVQAWAPDRVFNLVEALGGTDSLQFVVPALLESLSVRLTGSSSAAIFMGGHKGLAKQQLVARGLPTPAWHCASGARPDRREATFAPGPFIIKPLAEHASLGMVDSDVIRASSRDELLGAIRTKSLQLGRACFAEQFVDGREFNISLLAGRDGPEMLPPAEIRFEGYMPGKPKIVGSAAKWDENSFEYHATVRSFEFRPEDAALLSTLRNLSIACWDAFGLGGYARIDFRVDADGQPWILEANANPCLSPDAGFAAAADRAGISFDHFIDRILNAT
jgi:D-alanine-D-alanine ligase